MTAPNKPRECYATLFKVSSGQQWLHAHGINAKRNCCNEGEWIKMVEHSAYQAEVDAHKDTKEKLRVAVNDLTDLLCSTTELANDYDESDPDAIGIDPTQLIEQIQEVLHKIGDVS